MIAGVDNKQRQAWIGLYYLIQENRVPWPDHMSQEQIDYLVVSIMRSAYPGQFGKNARYLIRWGLLEKSFAIYKAKHPDKSIKRIYLDLAEYYGCSWSLVRKARQKFEPLRKIEDQFPGSFNITDDDLAALDLPHINFKNFPNVPTDPTEE